MSMGEATRRTGPPAVGVQLHDHPVAGGLRVVQGVLQRLHRRAQDVDAAEPFQPMPGGAGGEAVAEDRLQLGPVDLLPLQGGVPGIGREVVHFQRRADVAQRVLLERPHHHYRAVGGLEHAGQRHGGPVQLPPRIIHIAASCICIASMEL